jgi:hypothetical protein
MGVLQLYLQAVISVFIMTVRRDRFPLEYTHSSSSGPRRHFCNWDNEFRAIASVRRLR